MADELVRLKAAAEKASPGPWVARYSGPRATRAFRLTDAAGLDRRRTIALEVSREEDADYLVAVNPLVILRLIARLEAAEQQVATMRLSATPTCACRHSTEGVREMDVIPTMTPEELEAWRGEMARYAEAPSVADLVVVALAEAGRPLGFREIGELTGIREHRLTECLMILEEQGKIQRVDEFSKLGTFTGQRWTLAKGTGERVSGI